MKQKHVITLFIFSISIFNVNAQNIKSWIKSYKNLPVIKLPDIKFLLKGLPKAEGFVWGAGNLRLTKKEKKLVSYKRLWSPDLDRVSTL